MPRKPLEQIIPEAISGTGNSELFVLDKYKNGNFKNWMIDDYGTYVWDGILYANSGNDTVRINAERNPSWESPNSDFWNLSFYGGSGTDTLDFSITDEPMNINLSHGYAVGRVITDAHVLDIFSFENAIGTSQDDLITGSVKDNYLAGGLGNDSIWANMGDDVVLGHGGEDEIFGGDGDDVLIGGEGDDKIYGGDDDDNVQGGNGDDELFGGEGDDALSGGNGNDLIHGGAGDDGITGGNGEDTLIGNAGKDKIHGGQGDDALSGGDGNDTLNGGAGNDLITGGNGWDTINGGSGDDTLYGGSGMDTAVFSTRTNVSVSLETGVASSSGLGDDLLFGIERVTTGQGDDLVIGNSAANLFLLSSGNDTGHGLDGNDLIKGHAGDDLLFGGEGNDKLYGGEDDDSLQGDAGDDKLWGHAGKDGLFGGAGDDQLYGGNDDDVVDGGFGNNTLNGGHGDDFIFTGNATDKITTGSGADVIRWGEDIGGLDSVFDFNLFEDKIAFDNDVFDGILETQDIEDILFAIQIGQNSLLAAIVPELSGAPGDTTIEHIALFGNTNAMLMNQRISDGSIFPTIDIEVPIPDWQFELGPQYNLDILEIV